MSKRPSRFPERLGAFVADLVAPTLAARGLGEASLVSHWPEIVGADIARFARPMQLQWPPRGPKRDPDARLMPATLVLRIDGAFALEAQHASAAIIARVNAHLGWRCVEKLAFRQGPLAPLERPRGRVAPASAQAFAQARELGKGIVDDDLREALARLGARIIDRHARKG